MTDPIAEGMKLVMPMKNAAEAAFEALKTINVVRANDLVERLGYHQEDQATGKLVLRNPDGPEAATRITALERELAEAREALKPLIKLKEAIDECKDDTWECQCGRSEPWWTGSNAHYASEYPDVPK